MEEFSYHLKIPKERIAVLIGKNGSVKKQIEENTRTKIIVDSKEGDVKIYGRDGVMLYNARNIVKAIGRGFNPEVAQLLLKHDYSFEIINLPDFEKPTQFRRIKGRVIGREGKTRALIERYTDTHISVYGKTVSIIGRTENLFYARRAIEMLLQGSRHANVYRWLEKMKHVMMKRMFEDKFDI